MYDVIIIGSGPAGISCALYTVRANLKTIIIGKNSSSLLKTSAIENYYGFEQPISGRELSDRGIKQIKRLGAEVVEEEVVSVTNEGGNEFEVLTSERIYKSRAILIATGQPQKALKITNLEKFEGKGISYCTTCDGFFYKNLKVGVIGNKDFAIHEAAELEAFTGDITIFTNGRDIELTDKFLQFKDRYRVNTNKIQKFEGTEFIEKIYFEDGTSENLDGVFIANETASSADFARKLGVITKGNDIIVDRDQKTNMEGLYAAGDCTGGFKQISVAVGQGAIAGKSIISYIRNKNFNK